ncbi:MAG TPA: histidine kinase [Solirubrobacteraceae bacterium]|jgi:signal transduction histidine kinase|nr:histidine kinase [Solirubrobacteraceae bacterium]
MLANLHRRFWGFFTRGGVWSSTEDRVPPEVVFMRMLGVGFLLAMIVGTATTHPRPSLHGDGLIVAIALVGLFAGLVVASPRSTRPEPTRLVGLVGLVLAASVLAVVQPGGVWEGVPYYVAIIAAMRLDGRTAFLILGLGLLPLAVISGIEQQWGDAFSTVLGAIPWFLVMRQMRRVHEQNIALEASQAAEARAAAAAERGRLAREMHDVLAHTLSALALQLETTRLLAHDRGVDADVSRAIDQAHGLAAGGLDDARRAISTARGDVLPGPERLDSLAEVFAEQSGLPVAVDVTGEPRQLPADARLAVYRTAQEALTNIRRHAVPERVELRLDYRDDAIELVVEDHCSSVIGVAGSVETDVLGGSSDGYGLTGMRERAELAGGRLVAQPTDDGFRVELWLPA